jgi:hypothetical protein
MVWLDGLLTVKDKEGRQRMVARYARMKSLGEAYGRGLVVFNDATNSFEPVIRSGPDFLPFHNSGHAIGVNVDGQEYYYFATQFPLAVRMRVRAEWDHIFDPNRYEVLTSLGPEKSNGKDAQRLDSGNGDKAYRWVRAGELIDNEIFTKASAIKALRKEKQDVYLYDIESGNKISPHGGSVYFNGYRRRWIMVTVQQFGEPSYLGEVWYAEADSPVGPWAYTRKIVTHNKYSFYNPMHHSYFDQNGGRELFFEGTYSYTFSGSAENATPRYDYNQIMYRLNLNDPRLVLPVAVYQIRDKQDGRDYLLRDAVEKAGKWDFVESIPFYAIEPTRANEDLIPVYADKVPGQNGRALSLTVKRPNVSAVPLFYALQPTELAEENSCIVRLYEYRHADTGLRLYSIKVRLDKKGWIRTENPLCRVWKVPPDTLLLESKAKPSVMY